jgi:hypothetical protein
MAFISNKGQGSEKKEAIEAFEKRKFLENLNTRLLRGEVVGFFEPKPQGQMSAEMWEKYMEPGSVD